MKVPQVEAFFAKLKAGSEQSAIADLQRLYKNFYPGSPFDHTFLDDEYQALYASEQKVGILSRYFALLVILISALIVSFQAIKAARANPVKSLRSE